MLIEKLIRKATILFILSLFPIIGFSQTGKIEGVITDAKTGETLVGANVILVGTTTGVIADFDGHFVLSNLKPGNYKVQISFISYNPVLYESVKVEANKSTILNAPLEEVSVTLKNVEVVATKRSSSELSMISSIKTNPLVASGISSQQIQRSQDKDASEVIRRVPGITIYDDRFVIVRGLSQRYNNVWLNNASAPSSETDIRAFSFDVIPSGMIDNIMVYKSGAPELPADFSGGFINIITKNMPDSSFVTFDYSTGYRSGTTFKDFKKYQGGNLDWLGIDDGTRALPKNFPSDMSQITDPEQINNITKSFKNTYAITSNKANPDQKFGLTFAKRIQFKKVAIGNLTVLNYSNSNKNYLNNNRAYGRYNIDYDTLGYKYNYFDKIYSNNISWSILQNWAFFLGNGHKIEFKNLFNQYSFTRTTLREGQFLENFRDEHSFQERFMSRSTYSGQISGDHRFRNGDLKVNWNLGYALANRNEPDRKVLVYQKNENNGEYKLIINNNPQPNFAGRFFQKTNENIISGALNLENKFNFSAFTPTLKVGLYTEQKSRDFTARNIGYISRQLDDSDPILYLPIREVFNPENLDYNSKISISENSNKSDSYDAKNQLIAGYLGLNLPVTSKINLYGGVRAENNEQKLNSYKQDQPDVAIHVNNKKLDFFPSANMSFNFTQKTLVRLAYFQSVNRPEFREIAPYYFIDFDRGASFRGNTELKNAEIQNIDFRLEHYPSSGETFSLAFFYKKFTNPIEAVIVNEGSGKSFSFANAAGAENFGLEADVRKVLGEKGILQYFSVVINGALIKSKVKFEGEEKAKSHNRPLQGQSPYIFNMGLFYSQPKLGINASILYNIIGERLYAVGLLAQNSNEDIPDEYEMPRNQIDFTISKKFAKHFELKFGIKDLLNQGVESRHTFKYVDNNGVSQERIAPTNYYKPGTLYSLGLSMKF